MRRRPAGVAATSGLTNGNHDNTEPIKRRGRFSAALVLALIAAASSVALIPLALFLGHKSFSHLAIPTSSLFNGNQHQQKDDTDTNGFAYSHLAIPTSSLFNGNQHQQKDDTNGFAACLLVKDVNHWLPEWIAYHHSFLPLTELIVAVDPHSIQSPRPIFERFNTTIPSLHIDMWYDEDYISLFKEQKMPKFPPKGAPPDLWADMIRERYLYRQNWFMSQCLSEMQRRNRTEWVLLHDADEFVVFNRHGSRVWKKDAMPQYGKGTLLDYISATQYDAESPFHEPETCLPMPRLLFGSMESSSEQINDGVPFGLDAQNLVTMRYRHHVSKTDVRASGFVKPLINVRRSPTTGSFHDEAARDPHCPYPKDGQICHGFNIMQHLKSDWSVHESPLVMNHYVGSFESFSFGRRWFLERFNETKDISGGQSDDIRPWLAAFVERFGIDQAKYLLKGSGNVHHNYGTLNDDRLGLRYKDSDVQLEKVLAEAKAKKDAAKQRSAQLKVKASIGIGGLKKIIRAGK